MFEIEESKYEEAGLLNSFVSANHIDDFARAHSLESADYFTQLQIR